jgi:hypothetical protein
LLDRNHHVYLHWLLSVRLRKQAYCLLYLVLFKAYKYISRAIVYKMEVVECQ